MLCCVGENCNATTALSNAPAKDVISCEENLSLRAAAARAREPKSQGSARPMEASEEALECVKESDAMALHFTTA